MINFRFHLVSLVAVFLALTIGIVVGATIVNQQIVNGLNHRIDQVQKNTDAQRSENHQLDETNKQQNQYLKAIEPSVVEGRLTGVPVVVLAEQGVDRSTVRDVVGLLQQAGAQSPAIVWLQSKWLLANASDQSRLAAIVGDASGSPQLRVDGLDALADRLGRNASSDTGVEATTARQPSDVLDSLVSAGFITVDPVGASGTSDLSTFPTPGPRVVVLGGDGSDLATNSVVEPLTSAFAGLRVPTIAGELSATADSSTRGVALAPIVQNSRLDHLVSTVDDVDLVQGQLAVVLAIEDSGQGQFGHYGYGKGADGALPTGTGS
jgi:hypothetical protein